MRGPSLPEIYELRALDGLAGDLGRRAGAGHGAGPVGKPDLKTSDGYGTGFVIYMLHRAGLPADDARIERGIVWLKANQRASGRWFTRSLNKDNKHFIGHAGTAFALLALVSCEPQLKTAKN